MACESLLHVWAPAPLVVAGFRLPRTNHGSMMKQHRLRDTEFLSPSRSFTSSTRPMVFSRTKPSLRPSPWSTAASAVLIPSSPSSPMVAREPSEASAVGQSGTRTRITTGTTGSFFPSLDGCVFGSSANCIGPPTMSFRFIWSTCSCVFVSSLGCVMVIVVDGRTLEVYGTYYSSVSGPMAPLSDFQYFSNQNQC